MFFETLKYLFQFNLFLQTKFRKFDLRVQIKDQSWSSSWLRRIDIDKKNPPQLVSEPTSGIQNHMKKKNCEQESNNSNNNKKPTSTFNLSTAIINSMHDLLDKQLEQLKQFSELVPKVKDGHKNDLMAAINRLKINVENIQVNNGTTKRITNTSAYLKLSKIYQRNLQNFYKRRYYGNLIPLTLRKLKDLLFSYRYLY